MEGIAGPAARVFPILPHSPRRSEPFHSRLLPCLGGSLDHLPPFALHSTAGHLQNVVFELSTLAYFLEILRLVSFK